MKIRAKRRRHYKRSSFKAASQKTSFPFLIPFICGVGALVFAVTLGYYLGFRANSVEETNIGVTSPSVVKYSGELLKTPVVTAINLPAADLLAQDPSVLPSILPSILVDTAESPGFGGISFNLKNADGTLAFDSQAQKALYPDTDTAGKFSLSRVMTDIKATELGNITASGVFYCTHPYLDGAARAALEAYERALILEACGLGIDEIVLMGLDYNAESIDQTLAFLSSITEMSGSADIIVAVPYEIFTLDQASDMMVYVARCCEGVAIDLSAFLFQMSQNGDSDEIVSNTDVIDDLTATDIDLNIIKSALEEINILYYTERYSARLIVPSAFTQTAKRLISEGYRNLEIIN